MGVRFFLFLFGLGLVFSNRPARDYPRVLILRSKFLFRIAVAPFIVIARRLPGFSNVRTSFVFVRLVRGFGNWGAWDCCLHNRDWRGCTHVIVAGALGACRVQCFWRGVHLVCPSVGSVDVHWVCGFLSRLPIVTASGRLGLAVGVTGGMTRRLISALVRTNIEEVCTIANSDLGRMGRTIERGRTVG